MKLSKYLADYIEHEIGMPMDFTSEGLEIIIQQGIEAFESTENCKLAIIDFNQVVEQRVIIKVDNETFPIVEKSDTRIIFRELSE